MRGNTDAGAVFLLATEREAPMRTRAANSSRSGVADKPLKNRGFETPGTNCQGGALRRLRSRAVERRQ